MPSIKPQWLLLGLFALLLALLWQLTYPNYGRLESLLVANQWQKADQQTTNIILKESNWGFSTLKMWAIALATGKLTGWYEPIQQYPCADLKRLDDLWLKYSDGRFGLSVQQRIFEQIASQFNDEFDRYDAFLDRVRWDRPIDSTNAPVGHFPSDDWLQATTYGMGEPWMRSAVYLFDRIKHCQIAQE